MDKVVKQEREAKLVEKLGNLRVGQEDLRLSKDIALQVEERLIQVVGHFFKYDATVGRNILIKEGLFLCVDKVVTDD